MADGDPFAAAAARRNRRALAIGLGLVAVVGAGASAIWYFDGARVMRAEKPAIDETLAAYCRVLATHDQRATGEIAAPSSPGEHVGRVGWYAPDADRLSHDAPGGNADDIERAELAWLCGGRSGVRPQSRVFHGLLPQLVDEERFDRYELAGARRLLAASRRVKYVVVLDLERWVASRAAGPGAMDPGSYAGTASLYRLSDAAYFGSVKLDAKAPGFATVFTLRRADGAPSNADINAGLGADQAIAAEKAIAQAFQDSGVDLTFETPL